MMQMKIVIIGLGTAAFASILAIRKIDRTSTITVLDKKPFDLQHSCGLPYAIEKKVSLEKLEHKIDAENLKVDILRETEATKIIPDKEEIQYYTKDHKIRTISYDKLLIDTGSIPFLPPIEGLNENPNVFSVKETKDIRKIESAIKDAKTASIIGAGAIGIETAYALKERGLKVSIIEALPSLFPRAVDEDVSNILESYLKEKGIDVLLNQKINRIENKKIILEGKDVKSDIIICATGVRPNIKLAIDCKIETSKNGIIVNKNMQSSIADIYAAGDCIESTNLVTNQKFSSQLATTAYKQGTIAGENICGKKAEYPGSISTFSSVIGDMEIACTGLNSSFAKTSGFDFVTGKSSSTDKPEWFDGNEKIAFKILVDKKTEKIIGAQAIGKNASARINTVSAAIYAGMKIRDFANIELCYCPAVSQTYDVMMQATEFVIRRLK